MRAGAVACVSFGLLVSTAGFRDGASAQSRQTSAMPAHVDAQFAISFNGFDIGSFKFKSQVKDGQYILDGDAQLSALLGVVSFRGLTRVSGKVVKGKPRPAGYVFNFKSSASSGSVRLGFKNSNVKNISIVPPLPPKPDMIPLQSAHLKNVLDPLSAVMALTQPAGSDPCDQRISVFDGQQRFDLALSFRRYEQSMDGARGHGDMLAVCNVRYVPLGGYRPTQATRDLAMNDGIEVALRAAPTAGLFVPHRITIPTFAGSVVLASKAVAITMANRQRFALVNGAY